MIVICALLLNLRSLVFEKIDMRELGCLPEFHDSRYPPPLIQKDSLRSSLAVAQSKRGARCSPFGALFAVFFKGASDSLVVYLLEKVWTCPMSDFIPAFCFYSSTPALHGKRGYPWDGATCFPMTLGLAVEMLVQREIEASYPKMHRAGDQIPASNCLFKEEMSPWDSAVCSPLFVETAEGMRVQREIEASYPKMHRDGPKSAIFIFCIIGKAGIANRGIGVDVSL